jgi:glycosyltransferase involved in cell wall biosynthesis
MHICFITYGDIVRVATLKRSIGMATPLIQEGCKVSIIALNSIENKKRLNQECPGAKAYFFEKSSPFKELKFKRKITKKLSPDVVYVLSPSLRNWVTKYTIKNSIVVVEHSELASSIKNFSLARRAMYYFFETLTPFFYDGQVVASRFLEKYFYNKTLGVKLNRICYLPYAYNPNILEKKISNIGIIKNTINCPVILYIGMLSENYGIHTMLHAAKILHNKSEEFIFFVIGDGPEIEIARQYIKNNNLNNKVKITGYVPEEHLPEFFNKASIFVAPLFDTVQDWARCPGKLFMYAAFEKPVVTCDIGEAAELFPNNRFFYSQNDSIDMAEKIKDALTVDFYEANGGKASHTWLARTKTLLSWLEKLKNGR